MLPGHRNGTARGVPTGETRRGTVIGAGRTARPPEGRRRFGQDCSTATGLLEGLALREGPNKGSWATTSIQDPNTSGYAETWSVGPVASTNWSWGKGFIEAGTMKLAATGQKFPYAAWEQSDGTRVLFTDTSVALPPTGNATLDYWVFNSGPNQWTARVCGAAVCEALATPTLGVGNFMEFVGAGGESDCSGCPIGFVRGTHHKFWSLSTNNWNSYCYTSTASNNADGVLPSTCLSDTTWDINYK